MSDHHDSEQERDEAWLAAVYRSGPREEPPPALDRRILEAAARPRRRRLWPAGLATAAAAVLAVALLVPRTTPPPVEQESMSRPPAPASSAASRAPADVDERRLEETIVTGSSRAPEPSAGAAALAPQALKQRQGNAVAQDQAATSANRYTTLECPDPYLLPPDATLRSTPDGLEVRTPRHGFTLRCVDGGWVREPLPPAQPDHNNR